MTPDLNHPFGAVPCFYRGRVDYTGKSKASSSGYSWISSGTRLAHMIDKHLHYHIEAAMKSALKQANSMFAKGLQEACEIQIKAAAAKIKVVVGEKK